MTALPRPGPRFFAVPALALLLLCALTEPFGKGHAMGSPTHQPAATRDLETPVAGLAGHVARDDTVALPAGHLRLYRNPDATAPESIRQQADLIAPLLQDLSPLPPLADVTDRASALGASPAALAQAIHGTGKYTRPNRILALDAGSDRPAAILARIADDAPHAAVNVTFYCLNRQQNDQITISHFGPINPASLIEIKEKLCTADFD